MAVYELVLEEQQPTCGGKAPTRSEIRTVTTDDPAAYVRSLEPNSPQEVTVEKDGTIVVKVDRNGMWAKYEFTED
ncbi:MAG: hypothetical protein II784_04215 [Oscillospiraceae bacterium]|nr:hypothetical protein [Oscillospiraceae bacterium]